MRVAILDDYQNVALSMADWSKVRARADITAFPEHIGGTEALAKKLAPFQAIVMMRERTAFPKALIDRLPNLQLLVTSGMRNASIDLKAASARGIVVSGTRPQGRPTPAVIELTMALILDLARNITGQDRAVRAGGWQVGLGEIVAGKVLGVVGLGNLGSRVARLAKAFDMNVVAWSQNLTPERCAEVGVQYAKKDELLERSDFVSIHVVLSARTRGLITGADLGKMKRSAYLINTARGPIVDEAALVEALRKGTIRGAGLDVFAEEPLPAGHAMRSLPPNCVVVPHIGYVTADDYPTIYGGCAEAVAAFMAGEPSNVLNPEVLEGRKSS